MLNNLTENAISISCNQATTDWEVLNRLSIERLRRLLLVSIEYNLINIERIFELISAYHQVYRQDLIQLRRRGQLGRCPDPTSEQLQRIAHLQQRNGEVITSQQILVELQKLAQLLRQYP